MRIFKTRVFARFADKARIADSSLCRAVSDAARGLVAADLGGGIIKQRIARPGRGKSAGFRTLIVFRAGLRAIFVHGFAKNERANIDKTELAALGKLAAELLGYYEDALERAVAAGALLELNCDEETIS